MRGEHNFKDLFSKYKSLAAPEASVVTALCAAIERETGITLSARDVSYTPYTKTAALRFSGPKKQEVLLRKQAILGHVRDVVGPKNAPTALI